MAARRFNLLFTALALSLSFIGTGNLSAEAHFSFGKHDSSSQKRTTANKSTDAKKKKKASKQSSSKSEGVQGANGSPVADESTNNPNAPLVVPPSSLDVATAKFGKLELDLKDAAYVEARVGLIHLVAERLDMAAGTLSSLSARFENGEFQDFTVDLMELSSQGNLHFDINELLNNKVLQFFEPASAEARVIVSQDSLNKFINADIVLGRLSDSAKKRVPILSALARQDVNFGFTFTGGHLKLEPDDHVHLLMNSKLGLGKGGMPMQLAADTKLILDKGWVNLADTHLLTGGQTVPRDMADKIVRRINDLSKWGKASDDIQFQFTKLQVVPGDRLELVGTAQIKRLRFQRAEGSTTQASGSSPSPANGTSPTPANGTSPSPANGTSPSPANGTSPSPANGTSPSPANGTSPSPANGTSPSP